MTTWQQPPGDGADNGSNVILLHKAESEITALPVEEETATLEGELEAPPQHQMQGAVEALLFSDLYFHKEVS